MVGEGLLRSPYWRESALRTREEMRRTGRGSAKALRQERQASRPAAGGPVLGAE